MLARVAGVFLVAATACSGQEGKQGQGATGKEAEAEAEAPGEGGEEPERAPPPDPLPMGKAELAGYAYSRGPARPAFRRAIAAERAADWEAAEAASREALLLDRGHLEAHWLLALSLAAQGRHDEALDPLSAAVAGDWLRWGERSLSGPLLAGFRKSRAGGRFRELAEIYRERFRQGLQGGLLVVGRRGKPWIPRRQGATAVNHRSEIYAYELEGGRYLRVSRTGGSLVGFIRAPGTGEIAYASYRKVLLGAEESAATLRDFAVGTIDLDQATMSEKESLLDRVHTAELFYGGDAEAPVLYVRAVAAPGEKATLYRLDPDRALAKETEMDVEPLGRVLRVGYDLAELRQPEIEDVAADWDRERSTGSFRLLSTRKTITVPQGAVASRDSLRWTPERSRLSFATRAADPCSQEPQERRATLYVVDAATGRVRPVAAGDGPFESTWLDESRLAYVDRSAEEASVRLLDVATGGEIAFLEVRGGLQVLPSAQRCSPPRRSRDAPEPP